MSGGSYEYLYRKLDDEEWRDSIEQIEMMELRLKSSGHNRAATALRDYINEWDKCNKLMAKKAEALIDLTYDVEWVDSSDYGEDALDKWDDVNFGDDKCLQA